MDECEKFEEMISAHIDGELDEAGERVLQAHLKTCSDCRALLKAMSAVSQEAGKVPDVPEGLHESIMSAVRAEAGTEKRKRRRGALTWLRPTAIAAACCVVIVAALLAGGGFHWRMDSSSSSMTAAMDKAPADTGASDNETAAAIVGSVFDKTASDSGEPDAAPEDAAPETLPAGGDEAPVPEPTEAPAEEEETAEERVLAELDIVSARLVTYSGAGEAEAELSGYDTILWLSSLVSKDVNFSGGGDLSALSYELSFETSEKTEKTVYFYYEHGALYASREADRSESWPIDSAKALKSFIEY